MLIPLAIINHFKPTRTPPEDKQLHELYPCGTGGRRISRCRAADRFFTWRNFFLRCDAALKWIDGLGWRPLRARALERREAWMVERMGEGSATDSRRFSRRCSTR